MARIPARCVEAQAQIDTVSSSVKTIENYYSVMLRATNETKEKVDALEKVDTDMRRVLFGNGKKGIIAEHGERILKLEVTQKVYIAEVAAVGAVIIGLLIKLTFF